MTATLHRCFKSNNNASSLWQVLQESNNRMPCTEFSLGALRLSEQHLYVIVWHEQLPNVWSHIRCQLQLSNVFSGKVVVSQMVASWLTILIVLNCND